jgi:hypothetical protein
MENCFVRTVEKYLSKLRSPATVSLTADGYRKMQAALIVPLYRLGNQTRNPMPAFP